VSIFSNNDPANIERLAAGLSEVEVLDCWGVAKDELSQNDLDLFARSFRKGRAMAKARAVDSLFSAMNGRDGVKGALSYLVRVGDVWPTVTEEKKGNGTVFRIEMAD